MEAADQEALWHAIAVRGLRPTRSNASPGPAGRLPGRVTKVKLQEIVVFCGSSPPLSGWGTAHLRAGDDRGGAQQGMRQAWPRWSPTGAGWLPERRHSRATRRYSPQCSPTCPGSEMTGHIDEVLIRSPTTSTLSWRPGQDPGALMYPRSCSAWRCGGSRAGDLCPTPIPRAFAEYAPAAALRGALLGFSTFVGTNIAWILLGLLAVIRARYYLRTRGAGCSPTASCSASPRRGDDAGAAASASAGVSDTLAPRAVSTASRCGGEHRNPSTGGSPRREPRSPSARAFFHARCRQTSFSRAGFPDVRVG